MADIEYQSTLVDDLFAKRIVMIDKEVNETSCAEVIGRLVLLELNGKAKKQPIMILVNSFGGYTSGALGIADVIENLTCPVTTVCIGIAQSAGSIILAGGHKRVALPNADIMVHQHWQQFEDNYTHSRLIHEAKASQKHYDILIAFYEKHCKLTKKKLIALLENDSYLSAQEALEYGLIDEIGWNLHEWLK